MARHERLRLVVSGMVAGDSHQGGATWAVLQYVLGLRRLGHDVMLVEPLDGDPNADVRSYFRAVTDAFDLRDRACACGYGAIQPGGRGLSKSREVS